MLIIKLYRKLTNYKKYLFLYSQNKETIKEILDCIGSTFKLTDLSCVHLYIALLSRKSNQRPIMQELQSRKFLFQNVKTS